MSRPEMHLSQYMTTKEARHTLTGSRTGSGEIIFPARPEVPRRAVEKYELSESIVDEIEPDFQEDPAVLVGSILISAAMD